MRVMVPPEQRGHDDFIVQKHTAGEFTSRALIVIGLLLLAALLWRVAAIFVLIFGGIILAVVLHSVMALVMRFTPLRGRWALLVAILALIVLVGLIGLLIGSRVATQVGQLTQTLPRAWARLLQALDRSSVGRELVQGVRTQASASSWMGQLRSLATITFGALVDAGVIVFSGLYFAADPGVYRRGLLQLVPAAAREPVERAMDGTVSALGRWLRGVLLAMLSIGLVTGLGLWALGVPLALALGILGGLFEFIPYIGPIISAIPAVLVAFTLGPTKAVEVIALYVAVHLFEGELLVPLIQRWAVALPPAVGIIAVVASGWLFGLLGIIFATPMAVAIIALVDALYVRSGAKSG
jgi:predicted PurR-regulated permease PerM